MDVNDGGVSFTVDASNPADVARALAEAFRQINVLTAANELLTIALNASMLSIEVLTEKAFPDDGAAVGHMRAAFASQIDAAWEKLGPHPLLTAMRKIATAEIPARPDAE